MLSSLALTAGASLRLRSRPAASARSPRFWLVIVPLEAALSASRRVVALASTFAICGAGFLLIIGQLGTLPPVVPIEQERAALAALGIISASLYATGLALGAKSLARTSCWLLYAEEDRYRFLARNMTDVITRHARNGTVPVVSPAAEPLFATEVQDLLGTRPVRARACCRTFGVSHRVGQLHVFRRKPLSQSACAKRRRKARRRNSSGLKCAAAS